MHVGQHDSGRFHVGHACHGSMPGRNKDYTTLHYYAAQQVDTPCSCTQVIYHLNSKNEDHELDLQELAEQYETEIEQVLKDTADKINHFKAQLDAANDAARIAQMQKVRPSVCVRLGTMQSPRCMQLRMHACQRRGLHPCSLAAACMDAYTSPPSPSAPWRRPGLDMHMCMTLRPPCGPAVRPANCRLLSIERTARMHLWLRSKWRPSMRMSGGAASRRLKTSARYAIAARQDKPGPTHTCRPCSHTSAMAAVSVHSQGLGR